MSRSFKTLGMYYSTQMDNICAKICLLLLNCCLARVLSHHPVQCVLVQLFCYSVLCYYTDGALCQLYEPRASILLEYGHS